MKALLLGEELEHLLHLRTGVDCTRLCRTCIDHTLIRVCVDQFRRALTTKRQTVNTPTHPPSQHGGCTQIQVKCTHLVDILLLVQVTSQKPGDDLVAA